MRPVKPLLIAGPTASGKSALALEVARRDGGLVINADSMQVYRELPVLTARPSPDDETAAPHRLYGHVASAEGYSVARWLEDVARALDEAARSERRPIVVGGTGLYFKALSEGLSPVPPIPDEVRLHWRRMAAELPPGALHAELARRDADLARRLAPGDIQRVTRALEVVEATGQSLSVWQSHLGQPLIATNEAECVVVAVPRDELHRRCDRRFDQMMAAGALDEVRALLRLAVPADRPAMRALGVRPLARHLAGEVSLDEAIAMSKVETRQYVKRQETWLARFMSDWSRHDSLKKPSI